MSEIGRMGLLKKLKKKGKKKRPIICCYKRHILNMRTKIKFKVYGKTIHNTNSEQKRAILILG